MRSKSTRYLARVAGVESDLATPSAIKSTGASPRPAVAPQIARAARRVVEPLEGRLHLSVSKDVNGYTVVTPSADSRVIYVASTGSDANPGTITSPVATIAQARTFVRDGFPDQILFRRGDSFSGSISNWSQSGRSVNEPIVIGAYTDPAKPSVERPRWLTGQSTGFSNNYKTASVKNVNILGISFEASARNFRNPPAGFTVGFKADALGGTYGMSLLGDISNILVEDSSFQYYRDGLAVQEINGAQPANFELRRSVVADNYAVSFDSSGSYVTSEGIYAQGVQGLKLTENVFDHNGWVDPAYGNFGAIASIYNHNAYLNVHNSGMVIVGNIFANAASHGLQARAGGIVQNNLFINNPIAMSYGYVNGEEKDGGVFGEVSGNVIYGARNISAQQRGWGLEIGNTRSKANGGGVVVKNNIYSGGDYTTQGQPAIQISLGTNTYNPTKGVGINDLTIQNNTVYGWTKGIYLNPAFINGGTGRNGLNGLSVLNNEFQQVYQTPVVIHGTPFNAAVESWRGNRYDIQASASASTQYFLLKVAGIQNPQTLASWQSIVEPTAVTSPEIIYPDPTRSPASYNASIGGTNSNDAFVAEARKLSVKNYRTAYTAVAAGNYVKAGFSGQRVDSLPPTATLDAPAITAGGAATQTFTIAWSDDNQVNLSSVGNGDVLVTGPNGYSQSATLVSATPNADGSTVTAIYTVPAAGGIWTATANGTYTVTVQSNQVSDNSGNSAPAGSVGTFAVNIAAGAPTASLVATNITTSLGASTLTVTYAVASGAIDTTTIDGNDLTITDPNGSQISYRFVSVTPSGNGSPRTAIYSVDAPPDGWTPANNGLYEVQLNDNAVSSVAGLSTGQALLGTFSINVTVPKVVATATEISARGTAAQTITVTYTDASGINASSVNAQDIRVEGPGFSVDSTTGLTLVSKTGTGTTANPLVAVYSMPAPAGGYLPSQNGTYNIVMNNGQVSSNAGSFANGGPIGSFDIAIDEEGPVAISATKNLYKANPATSSIVLTIVYSDATAVDVTSLGTGDITVFSPMATTVDPIFQSASSTGSAVTATYLFPTPGGINASYNGLFFVQLNDGQVKDTRGNFSIGGDIGNFLVSIDNTPPEAFSTNTGVPDPLADVDFTMSFTDNPGVDPTTLDDADFRVIGPNGFNQPVTLTILDAPEGGSVYATYTLAHPAGGWSATDNGAYKLVVQPNQIADLSGNFMVSNVATPTDTFTVGVATAIKVTFDPVLPSPAAPGLDQVTFHFNQTVTGLDASDFTLTRDSGANLLTGAETLTTSDSGSTWTLSGLSPATDLGGNYKLTLVASSAGLSGEAGGQYLTDTSLTWVIDGGVPTVTGSAPNITAAGSAAQVFTVTYTDDTLINTSTIGDGDIIVTGPNGYSQIATLKFVDSGANGKVRVATYSVPAPAGGWTTTSNGTYAIRTRANQVADVNGNYVPVTFVTGFDVNIGTVDTTAPTFTFSAPNVTSATSAATMTVVWSDPSGVNASSIGTGDLLVTGPTNNSSYSQSATLVSSTASGTSITATYSVPAPAGGWTAAMNGSYAVRVRPAQVSDTKGNVVADYTFVGAVGVVIGTTDTTAPTAVVTAVSTPRTTAIASDTIVFSEAVTGFDLSDLTLTRSSGPNLLTASQTLTTTDNKTFTLNNLTSLTGTAGTYVLTLKSTGTAIADLANNALVTGASATWVYSSTSPAATITSVTPNPVTTSTSAQSITINGTNFATNATVKLMNLGTGTTFTPTILTRSTTQLVVSQVVGSTPGSWSAEVLNGTVSSGNFTFQVTSPTLLGITVAPNPVTGTTATLTATNPGTNTATIFAWSITTKPTGATTPTFSKNSTNAAKSSVITFFKAGSYTLKLTSTTGSTVKTATLTFTVNATATSITVTPATAALTNGQTQQMSAVLKDQFGTAMTSQPTFGWTLDSGSLGTVSSTGLYTAPPSGAGAYKVRATAGLVTAAATVTVTGVPIKINFQPASAATVSGYIVDSGLTYAARNGQTYGWSVSSTDAAVDRNKASTQLLDTNIGIKSGANWQIALANGTYSVKVSVGDGLVATTNTIRLEGTSVFAATKLAANVFSNKTVSIKVTDGKLTLDASTAAALATRVDYIEITRTA